MKIITCIILTTLPFLSFSKKGSITLSGWGETGIKGIQQNVVQGYAEETYYRAKVQADIKIDKNIDAQIDIKADSQDREVKLQQFYIKFDYHDYFKLKVGNLKQPFGYEQDLSRGELLTFNRSNAHTALSYMGYTARSFAIKGYYNYSKKIGYKLRLSKKFDNDFIAEYVNTYIPDKLKNKSTDLDCNYYKYIYNSYLNKFKKS